MANPLDTLLQSVRNKLTSTAGSLFNQGKSFVQANPTPAGFLNQQFQQKIAQPTVRSIQNASTFQAPLEKQAQEFVTKAGSYLGPQGSQAIQNAFPITQVPMNVGEQVRSVGRIASGKPNAFDIAQIGFGVAGLVKPKPSLGFSKEAIKTIRQGYNPEVRNTIGRFAQLVEENPTGINRKNLGSLGDEIQSLAEATFGKKAANLTNVQLKNLFDAAMQVADSKVTPKGSVIGLQAKPLRNISESLDTSIQGKTQLKAKIPSGNQPEILKTPQETLATIIAQGKTKERKFITTVKESGKTATEVKNLVEGQYIPKANDALSRFARSQIKADINMARQKALQGLDDESVAIANELIGHYSAMKDYDTAAYIANTAAENLTAHGRAVQAASLYDKLTPEGIQRYAASQLQKVKMQLKPEDTKRLYAMAKKVQEMPAGTQKAMAQQQLLEEVQKLIPTPITQKLITIWKAGLLTGLKTTGRNITSNAINGVSEAIKDIPATATDMIASLFTGNRTKTFTTKGSLGGFGEGIQKGAQYFATGFDERKITGKLDTHFVNWGDSPIGKAARVYTNTIFRALGSQDQPFYYASLRRSLYDQAGAAAINAGKAGDKAFIESLVKSPTEQMIKTSVLNAEQAVFQNKTALGSAINKAKEGIRKSSPAGGAIADFLMPFTGVPTSVAGQVVNYSPIGLAKTIVESIGKGKFDQRAFSEGVGRGVVGTAAIATGVALARKGLMTLDYPKSEKEAQQWELEGKRPFSILVDGEWKNIGSIGPQATALLIGGYYAQGGVPQALFGGLKSQKEQTFLKGISTAMDAIDNPQGYGTGFLKSTLSSFIPTIIGNVATALDDTQRETNTPIEALKAKIPGQRESLLPRRNAFGEPMRNEQGFLGSMLDIFNSSPAQSTPVIQELRRLLDAGYNTTPSKIDKVQSVAGQKVTLPTYLQDVLESRSGGIVKSIWEQVIQSPEYQGLTDDNKAKYLEKVLGDVRMVEKLRATAQVNPEAATQALINLTKNQREFLTTGSLTVKTPEAEVKPNLTQQQIDTGKLILSGGGSAALLNQIRAQTKASSGKGKKPTFKKTKIKKIKGLKIKKAKKIKAPKLKAIKLAKAKKIKVINKPRLNLKPLQQNAV